MTKRWHIQEVTTDAVTKVESFIGNALPAPIKRHLALVNPPSLPQFLNPSLKDLTASEALPDCTRAVNRIYTEIVACNPIIVFGDYDADGITSSAVAYHGLTVLGARVKNIIPNRLIDGYGYKHDILESTIKATPTLEGYSTLVITVDCGVNSKDEIQKTQNELGMDVIVTDHHMPNNSVATNAYALVNPQINGCEQHRALAGVGVVWNLLNALARFMDDLEGNTTNTNNIHRLLQFVAIGTVTDVMPLLGDNRVLVTYGLKQLNSSVNPGVKQLKQTLELTKGVSSTDIGFKIGPRINAAGRMGSPFTAFQALIADNELTAINCVNKLENLNTIRKETEKQVTEAIMGEIATKFDPTTCFGITGVGYDYHPGIVGIVAARLVDKYNRPAIVFNMSDSGIISGSCRSIPQFNILEALEHCSDLLISYGGHNFAAGVKLDVNNYEAFSAKFNEYARVKLENVDITPIVRVTDELPKELVDYDFYEKQASLAPFGKANPDPVWLIKNVTVKSCFYIGGKHLKLILAPNDRIELHGIMFDFNGKTPRGSIDIVGTLSKNTYRGQTNLQMLIHDFKESECVNISK